MNKYTLTFKDKNVESDYQQLSLQKRYKSLKIITFAVIMSLGFKGVQNLLQKDYSYMIHLISLISYFLIQLAIVSQKLKHGRLALVIVNHLMSVYLYAESEVSDSRMSLLLGVNQMAFTILLVLSGEYIEGVITIFNLTVFRIAWTFLYCSEIQFSAIVSSILLFYYISYFNYEFHQGKRSQFLLQFVDSHWEDVLKKLSVQSPYLIIQFQQENLSFTITHNHCEKFLPDCENNKQEFLSQSLVDGKPLKNYLFSEIISRLCKDTDYKPQEIILNYQKRSYLIELCIYQVKHLNVLLIFKDFDKIKQSNDQFHKKRSNQFCHIILNILQKLQKYSTRNAQFQHMQRKIVILFLYENLKMNCEYQNIIFYQLLDKVVYYCSNIKINLYVSVPTDEAIHTHPKLFMMIMLIIFDNSLQSNASISCKIDKNKDIKIYLKGNFDNNMITELLKPHKRKIEILFKDTQFNKQLITLTHKSEILVPFKIND